MDGWVGGLGGLVMCACGEHTCVCVYDQNTAYNGLTLYMRYVLRLC